MYAFLHFKTFIKQFFIVMRNIHGITLIPLRDTKTKEKKITNIPFLWHNKIIPVFRAVRFQLKLLLSFINVFIVGLLN